MADKKEVIKNIKNGHLLKNYGSWMYCGKCDNTVGYLCYTTYKYFSFKFECKCGNEGYFELYRDDAADYNINNKSLIKIKNRLCCPEDSSPLFSIVKKHLDGYEYMVVCKDCNTKYENKDKR